MLDYFILDYNRVHALIYHKPPRKGRKDLISNTMPPARKFYKRFYSQILGFKGKDLKHNARGVVFE
jgi:hypothetical protein